MHTDLVLSVSLVYPGIHQLIILFILAMMTVYSDESNDENDEVWR